MKNQTLENMGIVIHKLRQTILTEVFENNYNHESTQVAKTLINTYQTMLNTFMQMTQKELEQYNVRDALEKQAEDIYSTIITIEDVTIPNLIKDNEFKGVDNLSVVVDKARRIIRNINPHKDFTKELEQSDVSENTKSTLELSIKTGSLITQINEKLRATGKTTELIKKAHELDVTLIVGTHSVKDFVDKQAREMGYKIDCRYINNLGNVRGLRLKNSKFLVDDSTTNQIIKELINSGNEFVGGFNSLSNSLSVQDKTLEFLLSKLSKLTEERYVAVRACSRLVDKDSLTLVGNLNMKINFLEELLEEMKNNTK